jgi:hypothetical protein
MIFCDLIPTYFDKIFFSMALKLSEVGSVQWPPGSGFVIQGYGSAVWTRKKY